MMKRRFVACSNGVNVCAALRMEALYAIHRIACEGQFRDPG